jgi:hypothetical protein
MIDPQAKGLRLTVSLRVVVLVADGVGEVATGAGRHNLEVVFRRVGEPGRDRTELRAEGIPTGPESFAPEHHHRILARPEGEPRFNVR